LESFREIVHLGFGRLSLDSNTWKSSPVSNHHAAALIPVTEKEYTKYIKVVCVPRLSYR